jgi:small subunit ribosomal protein S20
MPIIKSAKKRVRVARKATVRNVKTKRNLRTALKDFHASLTGGKKTKEAHSKAQSALDQAVKKGVVHKNKAARKQKQLAAQAKATAGVKSAGQRTAGTKSAAPKKAAAKPAVKKAAPAKKAIAKKAPAKKPAAKKTTKK